MSIRTCSKRNNSEKQFEKMITNQNKLSRNNCGYMSALLYDPISGIDAGHGIGDHRGLNRIYRKVTGKCF